MAGAIIATLAGLGVLAVGSDQFVLGSARLALALRVRPIIVGAVVVGFGTSAPEMLVSAVAAGRGSLDIALGNIAGSNIANVTLVLGLAGVVAPMTITAVTLRREAPIAAGSVSLLAAFLIGGLGRPEGAVLLCVMAAVMVWLVRSEMTSRREERQIESFADIAHPHPMRIEIPRTALGLAATVAGAQLLVGGAIGIATRVGLSEGIIGLTLVAVGTSLPEMATVIQAARRDQAELIVGNVLGSNMFNSLAVAGIVGVVGPGQLADARVVATAAGFMVAGTYLAWMLLRTDRNLTRGEGVVLLLAYVVAVAVSSL